MIQVKIMRAHAQNVEVSLETGDTVCDALNVAELDGTAYSIRVGGCAVELDTVLAEDTEITLGPKAVKGGNA